MIMPAQQAALITPLTTSGFATIRDIKAVPTATGFTVTATTDVPIQLDLDWWSQDSALGVGPGSGTPEAGPTTQHSFTITIGAGYPGKWFGFNFRQDSNDTSGMKWRPVQGLVQLRGRYNPATPQVPVRWNQFGDGTRPANGGGVPPNMWGSGNWSSYTWAQYNPKGTAYPTP